MTSKTRRTNMLALLAVVAVAGCGLWASGISVVRDGHTVSRSRRIPPFRRIELRGSTSVTVHPGRSSTLRLTGGANRVAGLTTRVEGGTLLVAQRNSTATIDLDHDPARVYATVPAVEEVRIDGSGTIALRRLHAPRLTAEIHGSGTIRADGRVTHLRSRVDGSGELALGSLRVRRASVAFAGSGSAALHVTRRLEAEINGSATVRYAGSPQVVQRVAGSGEVEPR